MSHSSGGPPIGQDVLQERRQPSPEAGTATEELAPEFDAAREAEITRRHTELLDRLLAMPVKDRDLYLERAANAVAADYENDPAVTELTCLDGEDFEEYV